jgi:hypothetical protein
MFMRRFVTVTTVLGLLVAVAALVTLPPLLRPTTATWVGAALAPAGDARPDTGSAGSDAESVLGAAPPDARDEIASVEAETKDRERSEAELVAALQAIDQPQSLDFSVVVTDHLTARTFAYRGDELFETASIVKVDILGALLLQSSQDDRPLSTEEHALAKEMIEESDNDAASALWDAIDNGDGLAAANRTFGLTSTTPGDGGLWGLTTTTAIDQAHLVDQVLSSAGPLDESSTYVRGLMENVADDQSWGISAPAAPGEIVEIKNGWLDRSNQDGRWIVNSIGRISGADSDATIAVLSRGHASMEGGVAMVESITALTREYLHW